MRFWATILRPPASSMVLILPVRLRRVASGLMIESVRSVAIAKTYWVGRVAKGGGVIDKPRVPRNISSVPRNLGKRGRLGLLFFPAGLGLLPVMELVAGGLGLGPAGPGGR